MPQLVATTAAGPVELCVDLWPGATAGRSRFLLLHGNPGSREDWHRVAPLLAAEGDVAALDLPGFGASPRPPPGTGFDLESFAAVVVGALDTLGWREPVVILGHSHGGGVAQVMAARHPKRVAGVVPIATLGYPAHTSYRWLSLPGARRAVAVAGALLASGRALAVSRALLRVNMRAIFAPEPVTLAWIDKERLALGARPEILASMVEVALGSPSEVLYRLLPDVRCPVLYVHGEGDQLVPLAHARALHERLTASGGASELVAVPAAGHMLPEFQADVIVRHVLEWQARSR